MNFSTTLAALTARYRKPARRQQTPAVAALAPAAGEALASKWALTTLCFVMAGALGFGASRFTEVEPPKEAPPQAKNRAAKPPPSPAAEKPGPLLDRFGDPLPPGTVRRFGTLRFRHAQIEDLAFTSDGKRLIAGWGSRPLAVFDAITGRKLREVGKSSSTGVVPGFAVSPDGKWIAACGADVLLWEIETGRLVRGLHCPRCRSAAFSADGKVLAAAASFVGGELSEITLVELAAGKHLGKWTFKEGECLSTDLHPLAFSPDGKYLAGLFCKNREVRPNGYMTESAQVWLLDSKNGSRVRTFGSPSGLIGAFAFQPETGLLATIEKKGVVRFWNVETGKEARHFSIALGKWDHEDRPPPGILRFSADGQRCAVADGIGGLLVVVDARTDREVRRIEIAKTATWIAADLSRDGRAIAVARTYGLSCVRVWDVDTGVERLGDAGHHTAPRLMLSADERTLIGRSEDGQVIHWDRQSGQAVQRRNETPGRDGRLVRTLGTAADWTLRGPHWRLSFRFPTNTLAVHSLEDNRLLGKAEWDSMTQDFTLSPDGVYVAARLRNDRRGTVLLWNPEKEKEPRRLSGSIGDRCWTVLFSHDSKHLIAASPSLLRVWDVATARPIHKLATNGNPGSLLLTTDDRLLFSGGLFNDATVHVWDMETGKELAVFTDPPSKERGSIGGLALSTDERFLAVIFSREDASTVSVWETGSWKAVRIFAPTPRSNHGISMVFSRDGRSLFVSNSDSTILEWDVSGRWANGRRQPVGGTLNKDRLNILWRMLAETPDKAYPAAWEMLDHPAESAPFLIGKLAPVQPIEERRVRQLLEKLDADSFAEREEANRQLLKLGEQTLPVLRQALKDKPTLETKKRVERVIDELTSSLTPDQLRLLRALAVLEWSNRPEAGEHLRRIAGGDPSSRLTRAAEAAQKRH